MPSGAAGCIFQTKHFWKFFTAVSDVSISTWQAEIKRLVSLITIFSSRTFALCKCCPSGQSALFACEKVQGTWCGKRERKVLFSHCCVIQLTVLIVALVAWHHRLPALIGQTVTAANRTDREHSDTARHAGKLAQWKMKMSVNIYCKQQLTLYHPIPCLNHTNHRHFYWIADNTV